MGLNKTRLAFLGFNVVLLGYLIFRIINAYKLIHFFPFHNPNDIASYMTRLFWMKEYGINAFIPNWYDGFYLLKSYWPLWFLFTLPIYILTNSLAGSVYFSNILIIVLTVIIAVLFSAKLKISKLNMLFILLITFVNPISISNLLRHWRGPEVLGLSLFIISFMYIFYLDGKGFKLNWKQSFTLILLLSLTLLSYGAYFIFLSLILAGIFLKYKDWKIILLILLPLLLTIYFWYSLIFTTGTFNHLQHLTTSESIIFLAFFPIFWFMLYTMYKNKRPLRLYIIPLALSVILFTHLGQYIPVIRTIHPDTYTYFFIFLMAFMFVVNLKMNIPFKKLLLISLIPIAISFIVVSEMFIPHFSQPSQIDNEVVSLMSYITDRVIISIPPEFQRESPNIVAWSGGYYSYGAIYYNLSTPSGHFFELAKPKDLANINELEQKVSSLSCSEITESLNELKATQIIVYDDTCNKLSSCFDYKLLKSTDRACLYALTS